MLTSDFFDRPTLTVARELLSKYLVRHQRGKTVALMIVEVEAYDGHKDKASHAFRGRTKRTEVMFGEPGRMYVYFTYGIHWLLNIVAGPKEYPAAVLIRGLEGITGPARLTKALGITGELHGKKLGRTSGVWIEDRGVVPKKIEISRTPRIGVDYAMEWAAKPYRFVLQKAKSLDSLKKKA